MMNFQTFKERIASLKVVYSEKKKKTKKKKTKQKKQKTKQRESTGNFVEIKLDELYNFYLNETTYTTKIAREYISGYVYSPAVAVIKELVK